MNPIPRLVVSTVLGCASLAALLPVQAAPAAVSAGVSASPFSRAELARMKAGAGRVTILRDKWGIPHVFGKSDADAVFGMVFAQAEDDFNRVELNYINAMGRLAEVEGEGEIWRDLRMKLYIDPADMKAKYAASPAWLKKLMDAFADGMNWYLATHPQVKPKLITRFEPWMALTFSEGSIGGDIEEIGLKPLEAFYGQRPQPSPVAQTAANGVTLADLGTGFDAEPRGSNGFAIAPRLSADGHALLMINPHTSFYFRPEVHMVSQEGLNAYGAVTWGQFFIYQGFNDRLGWMHTSGGGDVIDEYLETVVEKGGKFFYKYDGKERPLRSRQIVLPYKTANGMASRSVTAYFTHHGPVIRGENGKWVSVKMMDDPMHALMQSYGRTKARDYAAFYKVMGLRTNSSNNTVYADADGNIAYFHGNFIPRRDPRFDWTHPVDGSDPATEWKGLHDIKETITVFNPKSGYISNTNNWPCTGFGASSPKCADYPAYMWSLPQNARGIHAERVLHDAGKLTLDGLIARAYDSYLTAFEPLVPAVLEDWDALPDADPLKARLAAQVAALRGWDLRWSVASVPTSLAVYWGQDMVKAAAPRARASETPVVDFIQARLMPRERLESLARASDRLQADFGSWKTPWGDINRDPPRRAGLIAGAVVFAAVCTLLPWISHTPEPVLAAIVIRAVGHSLNPGSLKPYFDWRRDRVVAGARASDRLQADFGSWKTPWGDINRFQRVSGDVEQQYDDARPSWPVGFTSANWGSLASFGMTAKQTTKRIYGDRGNSFVAAVEFGPRVRAKSILAGGESSDPTSPHFADQAEMYSRGEFKDVLYYKEDIEKQLERKYHPGE